MCRRSGSNHDARTGCRVCRRDRPDRCRSRLTHLQVIRGIGEGDADACAAERATITAGDKDALALRGHLQEDVVLGLRHLRIDDGFAGQPPTRTDRIRHIVPRDLRILRQRADFGVGRFIDQDLACIWRDGHLQLNIQFHFADGIIFRTADLDGNRTAAKVLIPRSAIGNVVRLFQMGAGKPN